MDFISKAVASSTFGPSIGADGSVVVPTGQVWEVQWVELLLETSSAIASRQVSVGAFIGGVNMREIYSAYTQTASLSVYYAAAAGLPLDSAVQGGMVVRIPFPKIFIGPGDKIFSSTNNLDSGDIVTFTVGYVCHPSN